MKWLSVLFVMVVLDATAIEENNPYTFTKTDIDFLSSLSLSSLPEVPADPSNSVADSIAASQLGHSLFFDSGLSADNSVACANCHQPTQYFTDGLKFSVAMGVTHRNAQTVLGSAYSPWLFWDGRKDSLWAQALGPLEDQSEHGINRVQAVQYVAQHYAGQYQSVFGESILDLVELEPVTGEFSHKTVQYYWRNLSVTQRDKINQVFANIGKSIMAYQRRLTLQPARFDRFIEALKLGSDPQALHTLMSPQEITGMRVFVGRGNCVSCHNGPLLTNFEFHNIGAPEDDILAVDMGRYTGVKNLQVDEFTCLSKYSDADAVECEEMRFLKKQGPELIGAFKTPSLRNIAKTAPYMQRGQLSTLAEVISHYNAPLPPYYDRLQHPSRPHFDIMPLNLTEEEQLSLEAFLQTLTSPILESDKWWQRPTVKSESVVTKLD